MRHSSRSPISFKFRFSRLLALSVQFQNFRIDFCSCLQKVGETESNDLESLKSNLSELSSIMASVLAKQIRLRLQMAMMPPSLCSATTSIS